MRSYATFFTRAHDLCRGAPGAAQGWISARGAYGIAAPMLLIAVAGACYGASIGAWRAGEMALYCAVKLPLLLYGTALVNGLLNGILARRFGLALSLGEALRAVMLSFALAALVLAAFAPVILFFDRTLPCPTSHEAWTGHNTLGIAHVAAISFAGVVAVLRQQQWMRERFPAATRAACVVWMWLAINLVVGAQLSWNLRPWFGSPGMKLEFLRDKPFDGTFYESVFQMTKQRSY